MSNSTRCAACKYLRRRCSQDCVLAPYFPANDPNKFASVHTIFGSSNVTKLLEQLPVHTRADAARSLAFEASSRIQDPIYGCTKIIFNLQQQIIQTQYEIAKMQGEIASCNVQQQINLQQHEHVHVNQYQYQHSTASQPSWANASYEQEEEQFVHLDDQQQLEGFKHQHQHHF